MDAANHVYNWINNAGVKGLKAEIISKKEEDLTPIIFVEIEGDLPETYFFYGHFDKQPPFVGWNEGLGPYTPVLFPSELGRAFRHRHWRSIHLLRTSSRILNKH